MISRLSRTPPPPHTLELYTPLKQGGRHVENFRPMVINYERSHMFYHGCYRAKWEYSDPEQRGMIDKDYAAAWALNRLGYHMEEKMGKRIPWSGYIYEVDLFLDGVGRRHTILDMANRIRAAYVDTAGEAQVTGWFTDAASIAKYGQRDDEVQLDKDEATLAQAEAYVEAQLALRAWPRVEPLTVDEGEQNRAVVRATGYMSSLHWRFLTVGSGSYQIHTFLTNAINTDVEFVTPGRMESNTETTNIGAFGLATVWDGLKGVIELRPDHSLPPYVARVTGDRYFNYYQIDAEPIYRWRDRQIQQRAGSRGGLSPWLIQPHIIRDASAARKSPAPNSWLQDGRDVIMEVVTMGDGLPQPLITPAAGTEAEFRRAYGIRKGQGIRYNEPQYKGERRI